MIRDIFQRMSGWTQLFFLFFFFLLGQFITIFVAEQIFHVNMTANASDLSIAEIWRTQATASFLSFLTPALMCTILFHKKTDEYLAVNKGFSLIHLLLAVIAIASIQPVVGLIGEWNQQINLPEYFHLLEQQAQQTTERVFLTDLSTSALITNVLIFALLPAISEEFFFRGIIQQTIRKISNNAHLAVWITAIIFSFIHFQFYGFFPRILLGALLGYIFVWSKSLWLPILIHFINNAVMIILFIQYHDNKIVIEFGTGKTWWFAPIGFIITLGALVYMYKTRKKTDIFLD